MLKELRALGAIVSPARPFVAVVGGESLADKGALLEALLPKVDALVRAQRVDEASALVDDIVMDQRSRATELVEIREALTSLRARRLARAKSPTPALRRA
jgi:3-phosphoglycerate kinase